MDSETSVVKKMTSPTSTLDHEAAAFERRAAQPKSEGALAGSHAPMAEPIRAFATIRLGRLIPVGPSLTRSSMSTYRSDLINGDSYSCSLSQ